MHENVISILRCPLCAERFSLDGKSLRCKKGHCYDIARQGYVNLVPAAKDSFYTRVLFESRAQVFAAGIFAPVVEAISQAMDAYVPGENRVVADAGCGEGYYLRAVCPNRSMVRMGFDLSKEAVKLAARNGSSADFLVGDLANIPLADGSCDAVLDVFTPANYAEFGRILKKDGVLMKLAPRANYLCQLREAARGHLRHDSYDGSQVEQYANAHMHMLDKRTITYTLPVDGALALHLARMTPMLAGVDVDALDLSGVTEITIDETMYIGTVKDK